MIAARRQRRALLPRPLTHSLSVNAQEDDHTYHNAALCLTPVFLFATRRTIAPIIFPQFRFLDCEGLSFFFVERSSSHQLMGTAVFNVEMSCGGCSGACTRILSKLDGVKSWAPCASGDDAKRIRHSSTVVEAAVSATSSSIHDVAAAHEFLKETGSSCALTHDHEPIPLSHALPMMPAHP